MDAGKERREMFRNVDANVDTNALKGVECGKAANIVSGRFEGAGVGTG